VTYNFDPERWFEIERSAIEARRARGEIDEEEARRQAENLVERYEEMLSRTDIRYDYRSGSG